MLGVVWRPPSDTLVFDLAGLHTLAKDLQPTKRNLVGLIGRFYDPLGFLAPVTIKFKILFQRLCQSKLDWDVDLTDDLMKEWRVLLVDLEEAAAISMPIPRSYHHQVEGTPCTYTLCGFCDASLQAYAAVVYLVIETDVNTVVSFIVFKTRVAPLRTQTIPRLELLSAFLLSRLITSVADSLSPILPHLEMKCYTDSQVALFWVKGTFKEWKPFVNNRLKEIRSKVHPSCWNHCPGSTNPADLPSRGMTLVELSVNRLWIQGPEWLKDAKPANP